MGRPHAAMQRQQPSSSVPEAAHTPQQPLQQHTPRRQQRDGTDTAHYKHHNQVGSGIHGAGRPQGTQANKTEGPGGADSTGCHREAATSPKQRRRRRPKISVLGGALGTAAVRDPCSPQRAKHSPQADKCDHLGCPSPPSALRIPAATQRHTYVSAPGPRPAHGLETQERAGGHAVRRIQRPQTACRSPPEPGESARTRRRQEPPFCRRFSSACTRHRGGVQQPPTAAEPPYDGGRRHAHHSGPNLPPQLTLGVSLKAPPAHGPWRMPRPAQRHHPRPRRRGSPRRRAGRGSVTMAMGGGPPLHRRPRGAGAAETTSWAVGGAPHMSPTPIWLVGIVARRPSGRRG